MSKGDYIIITTPQLERPFFPVGHFFCLGANFAPVVNRGMQQIPPIRAPHFEIGKYHPSGR